MEHRHPNDPNRRFYGAVTVSERGQVVIPAEARRALGIEVGDKLLVFGDLRFGVALGKADAIIAQSPGLEALLAGGGPRGASGAAGAPGAPGASDASSDASDSSGASAPKRRREL